MPVIKKKKFEGFSDFERQAMKNRAKELLAEARAGKNRAQGEKAVHAAIAEMPESDRAMASRFHKIVIETAPSLTPKTWYGMPAYANSDGHVVFFFQSGDKYKVRYCTLGFSDPAELDEGDMWPTSFALKKLTAVVEKQIVALVKKAIGQ